MLRELILLAGAHEAEALMPMLKTAGPDMAISRLDTLGDLETRLEGNLDGVRLLSFGTEVIVPQSLLDRLPGPSYNIHPGPPSRPGRFPSVFALYGGDGLFGTTVHEMTARVDEGAIVAVLEFPVPAGADRMTLDGLSYQSVLKLVAELAPQLGAEEPLAPLAIQWSGAKTGQKEFDALCRLPADVSQEEFQRRYRAVGEGPFHALEIELFGHRFALDNKRGEGVSVGGVPVK